MSLADAPHIHARNRAALRSWLKTHHREQQGVWLVYEKGEKRTMTYDDIVEELLCFGWVDSVVGKVNEHQTKIYIASRKPKSNWSKPNKTRIAKLTQLGLMMPQGKAMVALAKQTGTWTALDEVENLTIPKDLRDELESEKDAFKHFSAFPRSAKRGILEWILNAKKPETRAARIKKTAQLASKNIRALQ